MAVEEDLLEDQAEDAYEADVDDYYDRRDWDDLDDSFSRQGFAER